MENEKQKQMILSGSIWKAVFDLSWPAVIAMILLGANNVIDGIFIGRYVGDIAFTGVSITMPPVITIMGLGILIGMGAGALLSITIGSGDKDTQKKILGNVNTLTILISVIVMIIALFSSKSILFLMGGRGEELNAGNIYYRTLIWGLPIIIYGITSNSLIRSEGKMKTAALIMAIGLFVNICANYVLMVILHFGVKGAAIGTNIGLAVQSIIGFAYFSKKSDQDAGSPFSLRWDTKIALQIISMGLSAFFMNAIGALQIVLILNVLAYYGNAKDIAFFGVVTRIFSFLIQPIGGFMMSLSPIIGMNFGAGQTERLIKAFRCFLKASLAMLSPFWICMLLFPEAVVSLMLKDVQLSAANIFYFRIYMALMPVMPLSLLALSFFPAINKASISSIVSVMQQIVLYIPIMLILPKYIGIAGIYYGTFIIEFITGLPVFILVKREFRLLRSGITKWEKTEIPAS